jgi:broad specificity phosphatase PhoE
VTTVVLVRHGVTDWNLEMRAQGRADVPLNERGRGEAREVAAALSGLDVAAVYSSDLRRAAETAEAIASVHALEVRTDPDLREIDQGEWTGLTDDEIRARWPHLWGRNRHFNARPGGESPGQVQRRVLRALTRIAAAHPHEIVVAVSHGAAIRTVAAASLGLRGRDAARIRGLANGGIVSLEARLERDDLVLESLERWDGRTPSDADPNQ